MKYGVPLRICLMSGMVRDPDQAQRNFFHWHPERPESAARESSGEEASKHMSARTSQLDVGDMTSHSNNVSDNIETGEHEACAR